MTTLNHPVDDRPEDATIDYWHGDQTDFRMVTTALQHAHLLPSDANHMAIVDAFRHSRAMQAHAALQAAHLILDPVRLRTILGQVDDLALTAIDRADAEGQPLAGCHLVAAVATLIRDLPADGTHSNVSSILAAARATRDNA